MDANNFSRLVLAVAPFVLLGLGLAAYGLYQRQRARQAAGWHSTNGTGLAAKINRLKPRRGSAWYVPELEYDYSVAGTHYSSHRISFGRLAFGPKEQAETFLCQYGDGKVLRVYYDPKHPSNAVLTPGEAPNTLGYIIGGIVIFAVPILLMLYFAQPR